MVEIMFTSNELQSNSLHFYNQMNCDVSTSTGIVMVIATFFTVVHAPSVVATIIKRQRKRSPAHRMALQLLHPSMS